MHMPPPSAQETAHAVELGHEPSTVSVRGVVWFFVVFILFSAAVQVVVYVMYREMVKAELAQNVQRSALNAVDLYPPEPRLQPTRTWHEQTEPEDLAIMRGRENLEFVKRGWINEQGEFNVPDDVIQKVASGASSVPATSNPASGGSGAGMPR